MSALYDKRGIPIERGDLLKVFHFIGANRKRHYMYKQCLGVGFHGQRTGEPYILFSHLNFIDDYQVKDGPYYIHADGSTLKDYEVVQSMDAEYESRQRKAKTTTGGE